MGGFSFFSFLLLFLWKKQKELEHKTENTIISSWMGFLNKDRHWNLLEPSQTCMAQVLAGLYRNC